jgi:homoserine O-acetyltransferase
MVALALGEHFATRVRNLIVLGAAHAPHPMATALRSLQRSVVRLGLERGAPQDALQLARGIAVTTYRSAREFAGRFQALPVLGENGPRFDVEDYLEHHGRTFAERFSPESFLCLSQSIDLQRVDPAAIRVPATLVAFDPDAITPPWQVRELARHLRGRWTLRLVPSVYGHDAFLKEVPAVSRILSAALSQEVV